ncbi:Hydroperoxy fatty acid reductase gpx1 [Planctomycetes bacterium Pan216]|uniref:Glutathione peroxidase n=1 Tax=Kolteria novifilia TaxID=2527975 RepID=A0A518B6M2_9BACT|nr:Hydroperoxy fatty acid reductase gpx1 [Planctomycetes bacterium Pan216]
MNQYCLLAALAVVFGLVVSPLSFAAEAKTPKGPLNGSMKAIDGKEVDLSKYDGKVVLVVNTASKCGYTPQYSGLEKLYQDKKGDGLVVLGFPCNQFGSQEPGSEAEIAQFCTKNYGVTFPMFAKSDVNGPDQNDVYKYLTSETTDPKFAGKIRWNFEKFLIGRDGKVVARFPSRVAPDSTELTKAIDEQLAK